MIEPLIFSHRATGFNKYINSYLEGLIKLCCFSDAEGILTMKLEELGGSNFAGCLGVYLNKQDRIESVYTTD